MYKNKKLKFSVFLDGISSTVIAILNAMLLPLSVAFIYICIKFYQTASIDIIWANSYYFAVFEHLMVTLIIVICGSALLDISLRETDGQ